MFLPVWVAGKIEFWDGCDILLEKKPFGDAQDRLSGEAEQEYTIVYEKS
jgi:hypothetical protein